jgi:hypothetical protein
MRATGDRQGEGRRGRLILVSHGTAKRVSHYPAVQEPRFDRRGKKGSGKRREQIEVAAPHR